MSDNEAAEQDTENVIRIMVATDNHLGYAEKDKVRGEDSFTAFEEILQLALAEEVDMILLGGDLFHDAVPSQNSMHRCIELLRRYTFGDKPVSLELLSDQSFCFHNAINQSVNYEDPNLNIAIPVFSIHGNHDDPSGFGRLSSLDLLSTTGLVNYFGRWTDLTKVDISPILLRKGESKLALYGLSHIHDGRLARLFSDFKVTVECPNETENEEWFHLMVVHQNRADRGPKNYLPEELLPAFLHLVIWGHEHDCRIEPELNDKRNFYVTQPGSSVPTSLSEGESVKKHVGLLEIYKSKFQLKPLPLQTVRPFIFESVNLSDYVEELGLDEGDASAKVHRFAEERIGEMIKKAEALLTGHPKQPTVPLIRLRLLFNDESHMFNTVRFGQLFATRVANPDDVVQLKKVVKRQKHETVSLDKNAMKSAFDEMENNTARVEELVDRYFEDVKDKRPLKLMHSKALAEMTYRLVERNDGNAADNIFQFYIEKAIEHLNEALPEDELIADEVANFRQKHKHEYLLKMLDAQGVKPECDISIPSIGVPKVEPNVSVVAGATPSARGRGRGRGRAASTATSRSTRTKAQLDEPVNTTRSSGRQSTLLSAVASSASARSTRTKKAYVYEISDSSD